MRTTLGVFVVTDGISPVPESMLSTFSKEFSEGTLLKLCELDCKCLDVTYRIQGYFNMGVLDGATASSRVDYGLGAEGMEDFPFGEEDLLELVDYTLYGNPNRQPKYIERNVTFTDKNGSLRWQLVKIHNNMGKKDGD